jgi:S-disulfanyl-L-cysteine oxidoreductase SoxD
MPVTAFRYAVIVLSFVLAASWAGFGGSQAVQAQRPGAAMFDGVFTAAQAARGKVRFEENCASCHRENLTGASAPALKGAAFLKKWEFQGLNTLVSKVFDTMPQGYATNVQEDIKVDIVSYILQQNAFPAGSQELTGDLDVLQEIQILSTPDAAQAAGPIGNYSLVQVIGCLAGGGDRGWQIVNAAEPARSTSPAASTGAAVQRLAAAPLGATTFELINAGRLHPEALAGHKVETKGFVYREGAASLITVSALQSLGQDCR